MSNKNLKSKKYSLKLIWIKIWIKKFLEKEDTKNVNEGGVTKYVVVVVAVVVESTCHLSTLISPLFTNREYEFGWQKEEECSTNSSWNVNFPNSKNPIINLRYAIVSNGTF